MFQALQLVFLAMFGGMDVLPIFVIWVPFC